MRRAYYEGQEYAALNAETLKDLGNSTNWTEAYLPEHHRKHHYADQIGDGIDFLSDQVSGGMILRSASEQEDLAAKVTEWITALFARSGLDSREQESVREVLITGDLLAYMVPDEYADAELGEPAVRVEMWEAESMEIDYDPNDWQRMVEVRLEHLEETYDSAGDIVNVVTIRRFNILPQLQADGEIVDECTERVYHLSTDVTEQDALDEKLPVRIVRHGLPFLPFVHLHGEFAEMRSMWGKSIISELLMQTADRYNSVEQLEYLAVRYNSTATMVVTGDWAHKTMEADVVATDVADILVLPGSNDADSLFLPTDTDLLLQQQDRLIDSLFKQMGLQRLDSDKIRSFGEVSGYALEILNRKTDGTFRRIVGNLTAGYRSILEMSFVVDAFVRGRIVVDEIPEAVFELAEALDMEASYLVWAQSEDGAFPNGETFDVMWPDTTLHVDFGSGYIVDEVAVRDDFVSNLISRREALRQKRYSDKDIDRIETEIAAEDEAGTLDNALTQGTRFSTERS